MSPTIPTHQSAAILPAAFAEWEVDTKAVVPKPGPGQLLVKIHAVGLNPVDWKIQKWNVLIESYPAILGEDAAGEVVALGEGVHDFAIGDRVCWEGYFTNELACFQQYAISVAKTTAKIPAKLSYDEAASVPLGLAAAALAVYSPKPLGCGLVPAWEKGGRGKYAGKPFLVMGGTTCVGQYAIQLAKMSGFSPIIATASLKHADFLKSLGATHIIDRHEPLSQLKATIAKITTLPIDVAYDSVSEDDTQQAAYDVLGPHGEIVVVLDEKFKAEEGSSKGFVHVYGNVHAPMHKDLPTSTSLFAHTTEMLESGEIKPNRVRVLPNGLHGVIPGLKELEQGVSCLKLIVNPNK